MLTPSRSSHPSECTDKGLILHPATSFTQARSSRGSFEFFEIIEPWKLYLTPFDSRGRGGERERERAWLHDVRPWVYTVEERLGDHWSTS